MACRNGTGAWGIGLSDQNGEHIFKSLVWKLIAILLKGVPSELGPNVTSSWKPSFMLLLENITPSCCSCTKFKMLDIRRSCKKMEKNIMHKSLHRETKGINNSISPLGWGKKEIRSQGAWRSSPRHFLPWLLSWVGLVLQREEEEIFWCGGGGPGAGERAVCCFAWQRREAFLQENLEKEEGS